MSQLEGVPVYLVDDDAAVRDSLSVLLGLYGASVEAFESGAAILKAPPERDTGCMIIDVHLPDMSGVDLLAQLRDDGVELPAILVSGRAGSELNGPARFKAPFLQKPLDGDEVAGLIASLVGSGELAT